MKLPNFRLYETQATASLLTSILAVLSAAALSVIVFKNFNSEHMVIPYDPAGRLGSLRQPLVFAASAVAFLFGIGASLLGFNSLGQPRNSRQGLSWLGMLIGAVVMAGVPILFYAWKTLSEPMVR